jgi:hypothetical protein
MSVAQLELITKLNEALETKRYRPKFGLDTQTIQLIQGRPDISNYLIGPFMDTTDKVSRELTIVLNVTIHWDMDGTGQDIAYVDFLIQDCEGDFLNGGVAEGQPDRPIRITL